jgi:hypothetical protein
VHHTFPWGKDAKDVSVRGGSHAVKRMGFAKNTMGKLFRGLERCLTFNKFFFKKAIRIENR